MVEVYREPRKKRKSELEVIAGEGGGRRKEEEELSSTRMKRERDLQYFMV